MMYGKQKFPWPLWHRDICFHVTGVPDYKNKALISVSTSKNDGETYHSVPVREVPYGFLRLDVKMGFNYFQRLGPNKTRHITLWNTNPKIDYMPAFFMNYMMTTVLYANMTNLIKFSEGLNDPETDQENYEIYRKKLPYYQYVESVITDPEVKRKMKKVRVRDCPEH